SLGVRAGVFRDSPVRSAAVFAQDRDGPARSRVAAEPGVHRLYVPRALADRLGARPRPPPLVATPLVFPLERPGGHGSCRRLLRADRIFLAVHFLAWRLELVRAACLLAAGSILFDVIGLFVPVLPFDRASPAPAPCPASATVASRDLHFACGTITVAADR